MSCVVLSCVVLCCVRGEERGGERGVRWGGVGGREGERWGPVGASSQILDGFTKILNTPHRHTPHHTSHNTRQHRQQHTPTHSGRAPWAGGKEFRIVLIHSELFNIIQDANFFDPSLQTMTLFQTVSSSTLITSDVQSIYIPSLIQD